MKPLPQTLVELSLIASVVVIICLFWRSTFLSTIFALLIVLAAFFFFHTRDDIAFYLFGAFFGVCAEIVCVYFGVWQYGRPVLLGVPLWLPVLWGFAFLFARRLRDVLFRVESWRALHMNIRREKTAMHLLFADVFLYVLLILLIIAIWKTVVLLTLVLLAMFIGTIAWFHTKEDIVYFTIAGCIGPLAEIICIHFGAWSYGEPSAWGIPLWLPLLYALFGVLVMRVTATLLAFYEERIAR